MGWWNASWEEIEQETADSIKVQSVSIGPRITGYRCGCETTHEDLDLLHLCTWHEGYDEGVAGMKKKGDMIATHRIYTTAVGLGLCRACEQSIGGGDLVCEMRWEGCRRYWHAKCR